MRNRACLSVSPGAAVTICIGRPPGSGAGSSIKLAGARAIIIDYCRPALGAILRHQDTGAPRPAVRGRAAGRRVQAQSGQCGLATGRPPNGCINDTSTGLATPSPRPLAELLPPDRRPGRACPLGNGKNCTPRRLDGRPLRAHQTLAATSRAPIRALIWLHSARNSAAPLSVFVGAPIGCWRDERASFSQPSPGQPPQ